MCARPRKSPDAISAGMFSFATFLLRQKKSRFNIKNFFQIGICQQPLARKSCVGTLAGFFD